MKFQQRLEMLANSVPLCPICRTPMSISRIENGADGGRLWFFECPCGGTRRLLPSPAKLSQQRTDANKQKPPPTTIRGQTGRRSSFAPELKEEAPVDASGALKVGMKMTIHVREDGRKDMSGSFDCSDSP